MDVWVFLNTGEAFFLVMVGFSTINAKIRLAVVQAVVTVVVAVASSCGLTPVGCVCCCCSDPLKSHGFGCST